MAAKKTLPAPIDRPLSRAYLREFGGWSTEFPPGTSQPASLRVMENVQITREGAARVRPGLELLTPETMELVGSFEPFYLNDGRKAYLVAVREPDKVSFRFMVLGGDNKLHYNGLSAAGFTAVGWGAFGEPYFSSGTTYVKYVQIDNKILALSNNGEDVIVFHVGATKKADKIQSITHPSFNGAGLEIWQTTNDWIAGDQTSMPPVPSSYHPNSLSSSNFGTNVYNFGFFYTFTNELGESAANAPVAVKLSRGWGTWRWAPPYTAGAAGEASSPGDGLVTDPNRAADQLIVRPAFGVLAAAIAQGATGVNVYMFAWSDQAPVPVEAFLIAQKDVNAGTDTSSFYMRITAGSQPLGRSLPITTVDNRYNSSDPSSAAQGIVASDRLVLVNDKQAAAVVRWTTNEMGNYLNFAPAAGGGYKTLTSGNMQVPACVKLWQNPQSADTLTILCMGTDGHSTAYYMAPASVSSQSDNTQVMGFEETTATPGTTSPYGCEVANNALYHPLDDQLMKSTASNYNITHKSMTDTIATSWSRLLNKAKIVSAYHDQRIYYLVHNPDGAALPAGCWGNEVWVLDLAGTTPAWSRWLTPGLSLKKIEHRGRVQMALVRPDGLYMFDPARSVDDVRGAGTAVAERPIAWKLETNTQGANRAHDAWAHLRQVSVVVGSFTGALRYGVRGKDMHGRWIEMEKVYRQDEHVLGTGLPFDAEDHLQVARELKEWFFFASSVTVDDVVQPSSGQLAPIQYRYTPVSVNVGYDWGQVETFEYGRAAAGVESLTDNGVPQPYLDTSRT